MQLSPTVADSPSPTAAHLRPSPMRNLLLSLALLATGSLTAQIERRHVDFDSIRQLAAERVAEPYREPGGSLPRALAELPPADWAAIRFRADAALWQTDNLPFRLQLFHPGGPAPGAVPLHEFSASHDQVLPFAGNLFAYPAGVLPGRLTSDLGYSGFRVHSPLNRAEHFDELIVFLAGGAFRALGAGQAFGLAARALTLDTGPVLPEEFPHFTEFWIGRPSAGLKSLTVYALLDSPRAVGACEFIITPGPATVVAAHLVVTLRAAVAQPGFAPLSGMFWYGENTDRPAGEPRPEVHEIDGLAVHLGDGTALWRPLQNPGAAFASGLPAEALRGFGLVQRDRVFEHYGDLDADYDRRPSAWIEPVGDWGPGRVQLVEAPARGRFDANVTAFWVPDRRPMPGVPFEIQYRIHWTRDEPAVGPLARVAATHIGALRDPALGRLFWVDFGGESIARADSDALDAEVQVSPGARLLRQSVRKNPGDASWRVALEVEAETPGRAVELRCRLRHGYAPVSETWCYAWLP